MKAKFQLLIDAGLIPEYWQRLEKMLLPQAVATRIAAVRTPGPTAMPAAMATAQPVAKEAPDLMSKLKDQCLSNLTAKFLREEGEPGKRVNAKVKRAIPTGTRLRIVEIDDLGRDEKSQHKYPVIWARVVLLSE